MVVVELLLPHTAQAQAIINVLQRTQVARSVVTLLSPAVTDANDAVGLLVLALLAMLSSLENGRNGLVSVAPIIFPNCSTSLER